MVLSSERAYWLAWSHIKGVGPVLLKRLHNHFGSLRAAWQAEGGDLLAVESIGIGLASDLMQQRESICPTSALEEFEQRHPNFWTPADDDYPALLFEIADPPRCCFTRAERS
jgi:DNA processing protein